MDGWMDEIMQDEYLARS